MGGSPLAALGTRAAALGGVHSLYALYRTAGWLEARAGRPAASRLARVVDLISGIPHEHPAAA